MSQSNSKPVSPTQAHDVRDADVPAIRFEALEPRVLLSADVNPAALTVTGSLGQPGEQDRYEFKVDETRRVVFDSLTNRSDINWTLEGPGGRIDGRSFSNTDYNGTNPAFELTPGQYKLTIDGVNDAIGDYALRIIDADAAADLTPGNAVSGTLDGGNKTAVYRFSASQGDKFYFDGGSLASSGNYPYVRWSLIDPYGRQEGSSYDLRSDRDTFAVERSGEYLLLVEGSGGNNAPVDYQFNLRPVIDSVEAIVPGVAAVAHIDHAGKTANFTFSVNEATPLIFDRLTDADFLWTLRGPAGEVVSRRWASSGEQNIYGGYDRMLLPAGSYTLSVDLDGANTGDRAFRLLGAESAVALQPGVSTSGSLDLARGSKLYKVALNAGDTVYLDGDAASNGTVGWQLVDPFGNRVAGNTLGAVQGAFTVAATGEYWLRLDGGDDNAAGATVGYRFALNRVPDVAGGTLALGAVTSGNIALAGQAVVYDFTLGAASQLLFDALSNRADLSWSLSGPGLGGADGGTRFDQTDGSAGFGVRALPAGSYRLTVRGIGSATGDFAFRLVDLDGAAALTLGQAAAGTLNPGRGTLAYRFDAQAGDKVAFDSIRVAGGNASWRLVDRFGRDVAGSASLAADRAAVTLATGGRYTLLVEGALANAGPVDFEFKLDAAGNQAPAALPEGDALALGSAVAGTLASWDASKTYRFTLNGDTRLIMDGQSSTSAVWTLVGPRGTEVSSRYFQNSDAAYGYPVLALPAGDYALTVRGADNQWNYSGNGAYTFRLLDGAALPALTLGQQTAFTRTPANSTVGYRVEAEAGSALLLNSASGGGTWRLVDPFGREVANESTFASGTLYRIAAAGSYLLLNEGQYYESGTVNGSFVLAPLSVARAELAFNDQQSGSLAGRQSLAEYSFTLDAPAAVVFDSLLVGSSGDYLQWRLSGPTGNVFSSNGLNDGYGRYQYLQPGRYTLSLRNSRDVPADYRFRVLDRGSALPLEPGRPVDDVMAPGESRLFRFEATAGERFYFDGRNNYYDAGGAASWQLYDRYGRYIAGGDTTGDVAELKLDVTGEYLLMTSPTSGYYSGSGQPRTARFTLGAKQVATAALTLGADISGSIAQPGGAVKYSFTLANTASVLLDADFVNGGNNLRWSLKGPRGDEASLRSFGEAQSRLMSLPAGNYELTLDCGDLSTPNYGFRLLDLGQAPALVPDAAVDLALAPASRAAAYRLDLADGGQFALDVQQYSRNAPWRLLDRNGNTLQSGNVGNAAAPFKLVAGRYFLVIDGPLGAAGSDHYGFTLRRIVTTALPLPLGGDVLGEIGRIGERFEYRFSTSAPTTVLFDSLNARGDLAWQLVGPTGTLRSDGRFDGDSAPIRLEGAGNYTLTVTPRGNATGAFGFRLLDLAAAAPLALGSPQSLQLNPGNGATLLAIDASAGDYLSFDVASLAGGSASLWLVDANGQRLLAPQALVGGGSVAVAFARSGRHWLVLDGAAGNAEAVALGFTATRTSPASATAAIGSTLNGNTTMVGVPDRWRVVLDAPGRLLIDGLAGHDAGWTLRTADGSAVKTGRLDTVDMAVLAAGVYTLEIAADSAATLGDYSFRLLDLAGTAALPLGETVNGTLDAAQGARAYRVVTTLDQARLALDASAAGGAAAVLRVFDASGHLLSTGQWPLADAQIAGAAGAERLIVIDGVAGATAPIDYTLSAREAGQSLLAAVPGQTLEGTLAQQGASVSYRLKVAFGQELAVRDLFHDAGSHNIQWRLSRVGATGSTDGWWPDLDAEGESQAYRWLLAAGEYDLTIAATGSEAAYRLQLLDSAAAPALPADGAGRLADGRDARLHYFDVTNPAALRVALGGDAETLAWTLYRTDGSQVAAGAAGETDLGRLEAGRYLLLVAGQGGGEAAIDYRLSVAPPVYPALALDQALSLTLGAAGTTRTYRISLPFESRVQLHDIGSSAGVRWMLRPANGSGDWYPLQGGLVDGQDPEAQWPATRSLSAGDYDLVLIADQDDAQVALRLLDLERTVALPGEGLSATLAGREVARYRVDNTSYGKLHLKLATAEAADLSWALYDQWGNLQQQGDRAGEFDTDNLGEGRYLLLLKGQRSDAAPIDYQVALARPELPLLEIGSRIEGEIEPSTGGGEAGGSDASISYRLLVPVSGYYSVRGLDSDPAVRWAIEQGSGSNWHDWRDFGVWEDDGDDPEMRDPQLVYLNAGEYTLSLRTEQPVSRFALQLLELTQPTGFTGALDVALAAGEDVKVFRFDGADDDGERVKLALAADSADLVMSVYQDYGTALAAVRSSGEVELGSGSYLLVLKRRGGDATQAIHVGATLSPLVAAPVALTPDQDVAASLDLAGNYRQRYSFTLAERSTVLLDTLGQLAGNVDAELIDASGRSVFSLSANYDAQVGGVSLAAGDYTLVLRGYSLGEGSGFTFRFNLRTLAATDSTALEFATPVQGSLASGDGARFYRIDAAVGDMLSVAGSGTGAGYWRLFDAAGNTWLNGALGENASGFEVQVAGSYWLVVDRRLDGESASEDPLDFEIGVYLDEHHELPVPAATPIGFGQALQDTLAPGARKGYGFTLAQGGLVAINATAGIEGASWRLRHGQDIVAGDIFIVSGHSAYTLELAAGDYVLEAWSDAETDPVEVELQLESSAQAVAAAVGTPIETAGRSLYAIELTAGQEYLFKPSAGNWTLYRPDLADSYGFDAGHGDTVTIASSGTWYLVHSWGDAPEGAIAVGTVPTATLTDSIEGHFGQNGGADLYDFELAQADRFYLSAAQPADYRVTLYRDGQQVDSVNFGDPEGGGAKLIALAAGHYRLRVESGNAGEADYRFGLRAFGDAALLATGAETEVSLRPGDAAVFRIDGPAGQRLGFTPLDLAGVDGRWRFYDAYGNQQASGSLGEASGWQLYGSTGGYLVIDTVTDDGDDAALARTLRFRVADPATEPAEALTPGQQVAADLAAGDHFFSYRFTLDSRSRLLFDAIAASGCSVQWSLSDETRQVGSGEWSAPTSDADLVLDLRAGTYTLRLRATAEADGARLAFALSDLFGGSAYAIGDAAAGTLQPGEARIFHFDASAGDSVRYLPQATAGLAGRWRVYGPEGYETASGALDAAASIAFASTGHYTLVWSSDAQDGAAAALPFGFALQREIVDLSQPLTGGPAYGSSNRRSYLIEVSEPQRLLLDLVQLDSYLQWSLTRDDVVVASQTLWGASSGSGSNPVLELRPGRYRLNVSPYGWWGANPSYQIRLLDLATAQPLSLEAPLSIEKPAGEASIHRFEASAGSMLDVAYSDGTSGTWRLFDEFGNLVRESSYSDRTLPLARTGSYYLLWDTEGPSQPDGATRSSQLTLSLLQGAAPTELALDTLVTGTSGSDGKLDYVFDTTGPATLWLDPRNGYLQARAEIYDANGVLLHQGDYYDVANQAIKLPAAGRYTLKLRDVYGNLSQRQYSFSLVDLGRAAQPLAAETATQGTLDPASGVTAYRFSVGEGADFQYDALPGGSGSVRWKLVSSYGAKIAEGDSASDGASLKLAAGDYLLVLDGNGYQGGSVNYSFMLHTALAALPLDTTVSGTAPAAGTSVRYALHLDQVSALAFDSLVTGNQLQWRLEGPSGVVFDRSMRNGFDSYWDYYYGGNGRTDYSAGLPAGDYVLSIYSNGTGGDPYSFRVLSLDSAAAVQPGMPVTTTVSPENGVQLYRFDATAGERFYFDALATVTAPGPSGSERVAPTWKLIDPLGRTVFGAVRMGSTGSSAEYDYQLGQYRYRYTFTGTDQEPAALALTGTYTLVLDGQNYQGGQQAEVAFNLVRLADNPPVILDTLLVKPAPDLAVNAVALSPASGLETGQPVTVQWTVENRGVLPTTGSWNDRIIVRNLDTGALVADLTVPYDAAVGGALAAGAAQVRSTRLQLPDGTLAAGRLAVTVLTDSDNTVKESNAGGTAESNNSATVETRVALAAYADLAVEGLALSPSGDFQPGQTVDVSWTTANRGNKAAGAWSERLEVRNLSTGETVATVLLRDPADAGELAAGATRTRTAQFAWPVGVAASGRFSIRVVADSLGEIVEANAGGSGESNNTAETIKLAGPDLTVKNLVVDTTQVQAGGLVTLRWEDWNEGSSSASAAYDDRIVVRNLAGNLLLLDTSLAYDPQAPGNGPLRAGEHRARSFTFRLPDGLKGAGQIGITVTADQNSAGFGVLFETNLSNDAESNNSAAVQTASASQTYADLRVDGVAAPATGVGSQPITVDWTVANRGQRDAAGSWDDQIVLSANDVIGDADDVVIGTVRHDGGLRIGGSYAGHATVDLPLRQAGRYYVGVKSDAGGAVLEPDTRADNRSAARAIDLAEAYADLVVGAVTVPESALSGENVLVSWTVTNTGSATTDLALWNDRVVLSRDRTASADDIVLSGSVTHAGLLAPGASYIARATMTLPRDLAGDFYLLVDTNTNRTVDEKGRTANNLGASAATLHVGLAPTADLAVSGVTGPTVLRPGESATVRYTASNHGDIAATGAWRDRIYIDRGAAGLYEVASLFVTDGLAAGASTERSVTFTLPSWFWEGDYRWVVRTDSDDTVFERNGEGDNQVAAAAGLKVAKPDLAVGTVEGPSLVQSGSRIHVEWTVGNSGNAALGNWVDRVYLVKGNVARQLAEVAHTGPLAAGGQYRAAADLDIPLDFDGEYQLVVVTDAGNVLDEHDRASNRAERGLAVELAPYADLAVTAVTAPDRVIDDPAPLNVSWTVQNQGTGAGKSASWTDKVILSKNGVLGDGDDIVIGEFRHDGALAAGEQYVRNERILLAPNTSGRYQLFVVSDARAEVYEHGAEGNNSVKVGHDVDVMPKPYADLQVESVVATGTAASGRPLHIEWRVKNDGIGITDTGAWSDYVWLSRNADGSDKVVDLGWAGHIGQLAAGDAYVRSVDVTLPEGLEGNFYVHVRTGGPYEFIYGDNNVGHSVAVPVTLSRSPDLVVETVTIKAEVVNGQPTVQEGALVEIGWTVKNQGEAAAEGVWTDTVLLVPASGTGQPVVLGSYSYDRGAAPGIRYERTELVRLPGKIEGLYRIKVITNANLGGSGSQVYEHGAARGNNALLSAGDVAVRLNDRPDLRVTDAQIKETGDITAGTSIGLSYTVQNMGAEAANGRWKDKVFLSLDGTLSADDILVGQYDNGGALAPTGAYRNETATIDIPIRYRGHAFLIVVADGNNVVDEYPSEANNIRAVEFDIKPVPFADLVTGGVVAPDQAVHGASVEVRYQVSNRGSAVTRAESATVSGWTDTIWLSRDKTRPGKPGDVLIGTVRHEGHLAVGEDYLGTAQVTIPTTRCRAPTTSRCGATPTTPSSRTRWPTTSTRTIRARSTTTTTRRARSPSSASPRRTWWSARSAAWRPPIRAAATASATRCRTAATPSRAAGSIRST
ncbi:CARDB domain-containing protein [Chitinimonas koreensis]|uniref:CARDB domain-containing protein n=1 Tax=Chitinimonas koreensis TaxID=356302 RepID=UPI001654578A|nr:CARDB domain-containing protein [Chitinimonas koreensis]QNM95072.1 LEPR-XLL domain-containing protein [Chitinimonas koreensis]